MLRRKKVEIEKKETNNGFLNHEYHYSVRQGLYISLFEGFYVIDRTQSLGMLVPIPWQKHYHIYIYKEFILMDYILKNISKFIYRQNQPEQSSAYMAYVALYQQFPLSIIPGYRG